MGKIITFYSYKGGTGRTMALANVAYLLALWHYKVLMVDWDLEAPGLEYFFSDYINIDKVASNHGVIDILTQIQEEKGEMKLPSSQWKKYITKINLPQTNLSLDLLTAGKRDTDYFQRIRDLDIKSLYLEANGGIAIEKLRNQWKDSYDFVLIDSRTGITDIGGICTIQLPDVLLLLFTATDQAVDGVAKVSERAYEAQKNLLSDRLRLISIPIASRFDSKEEFKLSEKWLNIFAKKLGAIYSNWLPTSVKPIQILEATRIPYSTYFSFGEKLPVVEQSRRDSGGLTFAYENISALIANDMENVELLIENRDGFVKRASVLAKRREPEKLNIFISYSHKDTGYLDRLLTHLKVLNRSSALNLWDDTKITAGHNWYTEISRAISQASVVILVLSPDYLASEFIWREEFSRILKQEREGNLRIIPLILKPCLWEEVELVNHLQVFPNDGKPLNAFPQAEQDKRLVDFTKLIKASLEENDDNQ
jgi:cellulose biosynthesis protein BcsQ